MIGNGITQWGQTNASVEEATAKKPNHQSSRGTSTAVTVPDPRAMEGFMSAIGGRRAIDATAKAQEVMYGAWDQTTARARIALARKALAISPLCADAYVLLAEEDAKSDEEALEPLHALLGRARAQIPRAVRFVTVRSERVAEEVEAFVPSILQRGLGLIECQPEPRHHCLCPRQRLGRTSATEDDEVVSIRDDVRTKRFPARGQPPILQEPIHVDVGKQWARDAALRRAAHIALATTDASGPVAIIPIFDWRFQPQLDQPQRMPVHNPTSYTLHKIGVRN